MLRRLLAFSLFLLVIQVQAQSLSPAVFEAEPWRHHPDTSPLATAADRQFGLQLASSLRFHTLPLLMPQRFRLLSSRNDLKIQTFIDQALTRILKTPTGKKICEQSTNGIPKRIQDVFGVTETAANNLSQVCKPKVMVQLANRAERPREYIFFQTTDTDPPVEGWTTPHNVSYIFLTAADFNEKFLFRVLAHEMAIQLDLKELWGWLGDLKIMAPQLGIAYKGENACAVQHAIRHPLIKYSFSALRAQTMETSILKELGLQPETEPLGASCIQQVTSLLPSLLRVGSILGYERQYLSAQMRTCPGNSDLDIFSALQILEQEKVEELNTHQNISICEFLRTPHLSSLAFGPFRGGPRPRVGPWAEKSKQLQDKGSLRNPETARELERILTSRPRSQSETDQSLKNLFEKEQDRGRERESDDETNESQNKRKMNEDETEKN